jgi:mannose-1-phosphate guanylyltransferase/mannose-6-phosphate isomerase
MAQEHMVIYGIKPNCPHTWYEYISFKPSPKYPTKIEKFVTRPATAEIGNEYIKKWYLWNWGIFLFSKKVFFDELKKCNKPYFDIVTSSNDIVTMFNKLPDETVDFGLIQLSDNVYVTPIDNFWTDLWSFDAQDEYSKYIGFKNENIIEIDSHNNNTFSEVKGKKIALIWVDDFIVVDTKDALLISKKWESQKIKEVINILKDEKSELANYGITVYRPWGSYTIIDEGPGFKSKRITVSSDKKLSLQMHYHRSEHWVVVSGTAIVTIWEEEIVVRKWESVFIPAWEKHRLENKWKLPLHLIESQIWDYLEEDDIVRYDDEYWRK